jgi:hypothetical protein
MMYQKQQLVIQAFLCSSSDSSSPHLPIRILLDSGCLDYPSLTQSQVLGVPLD